jgi:hypothetical protein
MRESVKVKLPKNIPRTRYNIQEVPKKNLQVYIPQTTFKKMLTHVKQGVTLSDITTMALEEYL